jgi:tetratricopeptide (TPR) repeat protein
MGEHGTREEIEEGLDGRLPAERSKEIVRHLLHHCPECRAAVRQIHQSRVPDRTGELPPELSVEYNAVLDRTEDFARRAMALPPEERRRFRKAFTLLRTGDGVLALAEAGNMRIEGLGVYEALLARSWAIRYEDPRQMCHLAKVAVEMAQSFDPKKYGPWRVADYAARAWGELANAYRVADRLRESQQAFGTAYELYRQGSQDRRLRMRLLDLETSLLGTLREFDAALPRLTFLADLYREDGENHLAGRTLITKALYTFYRGQVADACRINAEGLALIEEGRDPMLVSVANKNQLLFLVDAGRFSEAKRLLFRNRARFHTLDRILKIRLRGIEGRICYGLGQFESAENAFREVIKGFADSGLLFACAIERLDLALTLLRQGRADEAAQEGIASAAMFNSLRIHREVLGSVLVIEEALREKKADFVLLENTMAYLRRKAAEVGFR